jgi:ribosome-binding protein aMBF1 (putative translation factor)
MDYQDWNTVTIRGESAIKRSAAAAAATRPKYSAEAEHLRKIANADGPVKSKTLSSESRQAIVLARVANKWSQADLNMRCAFGANTIRDIEAGRVTPSGGQLNTLSRILKIQLKLS